MKTRVLVTGSRYLGSSQVRGLVAYHLELFVRRYGKDGFVIVHGDCPTGIDRLFREQCEYIGVEHDPHPADWDTYGTAAGPVRNQEMVDLGADVCLAYPHPTEPSKGTNDCLQRAKAFGIPVHVTTVPISLL